MSIFFSRRLCPNEIYSLRDFVTAELKTSFHSQSSDDCSTEHETSCKEPLSTFEI